jgi:hypothetical protein
MNHPRIPHGCDQQGRYPQAAEPCTELGQEHDETTAADVGRIAMLLVLAAVLTVITVVLAMIFAS